MDSALFAGIDPAQGGQDLFEFGVGSQADLLKALTGNEGITDVTNLFGGPALQRQSLEGQLASITIRESLIKLYRAIPKTKAYSTVEEASILQDVGQEGGFVGQMESPPQGDPEMARKVAVVKYLRTNCRVGDVLELTNKIVSAVNVATTAGILRILRALEGALFYGNSTIIPEEIDGLEAQILSGASGNVVDLRGADITPTQYKLAAETIALNYGQAGIVFQSYGVQSRLDSFVEPQSAAVPGAARIFYPQAGSNWNAGEFNLGFAVKGVKTSFGDLPFEPDLFIGRERFEVPQIFVSGVKTEGPTSSQAPAMPTFALTPNAPVVAGSLWGADAGTYAYRICAVNQYGKSMAAASQSAAVAATGSISIAITDGSGPFGTKGYEIYRETAPGSGKIRLMTRIARTGPTTTFEDKDFDLPGTSHVFILDMNTLGEGELRTMYFKQLAPMHKTPLAKIGPFIQWLQNLYGTLFLYAPQKQFVFKNVKANF